MHTCVSCGKNKTSAEFSKCSARKSGLQSYCKACAKDKYNNYSAVNREKISSRMKDRRLADIEKSRAQGRSYYRNNREKRLAYAKIFSKENRESISAKMSAYRLEKKVEISEQRAGYRSANKDKLSVENAEYRKSKPEKIRAIQSRRRSAKANASVKWANQWIIEEIFALCVARSIATGVPHQVDHIVPLRSKIVCGLHCEANLQVITKHENISKSNRYWPDMP